MLTCIGSRGREIYNTFEVEGEDDRMNVASVLRKFEEFCIPRKNITMLRHKFFIHRQVDGQRFHDFVTDLRKLSEGCELGDLRDSLLRDIIICGLYDNKLRERMLREPDLDLQKAIQLGQAAEDTKQHLEDLSSEMTSSASVHRLSRNTHSKDDKVSKTRFQPNKSTLIKKCKLCGNSHNRGDCPAYGRTCHNCQKRNHFAKFCPHRKVRGIEKDNNQPDPSYVDSDSDFFLGTINVSNMGDVAASHLDETPSNEECPIFYIDQYAEPSEWSVDLVAHRQVLNFKIDNGAQCNVLPKREHSTLTPKPKVRPTKLKLTAYNCSDTPVLGTCLVNVLHKNNYTGPLMFSLLIPSHHQFLGFNLA